uniref:Uncharacterized protein n=1 Tax=Hyaloperonospora arabidopsidis (strain Emoy2) TaxID=559515 RepID=M4BUH3_HYAAE
MASPFAKISDRYPQIKSRAIYKKRNSAGKVPLRAKLSPTTCGSCQTAHIRQIVNDGKVHAISAWSHLQFGVEVKTKDANGSAPCWCLFCVHEGRDEVEIGQNGRKRKRTGNIKMFTAQFFPHKYRSYLASQHAESWALYQEMFSADKKQYFTRKIKPTDTLHRHMSLKNDTLTYDISTRIVDTIIGDLFFRDEEMVANADSDNDSDDDVVNAIAKKAAKQANERINALDLLVNNENDPDWYEVIIKSVMWF